ncbi:MAG: SusC/RagA family TonB-linked outer membrane protein, partial [Chitinophagaceae bacterium]|nr:SusC/RagA family TonB-linked outer membrane protein [Chitinophagaceae bacterium]
MEKNISQLDEVQYIAYGTQTKRFSVGNVTTVKGEDIAKQPVNNVMLALQGRVPGLTVIQQTGVNGGAVKIRIQGENSINSGNNPLIVIDGVPYPTDLPMDASSIELIGNGGFGSPLSFLNTNDIESVDVLKDADATSIYGSRAANGAILITTKKGKPGKMRVNINLQQGWSKVSRKMKLLDRRQYLDMRYEAINNSGMIPTDNRALFPPYVYAPDLLLWDTTRSTDWQEELIGETAQYSNYNASVSGGTATTSYLVGLTYNRQTDVFPGNHALTSGGLHFNLNTASLNQRFKLQFTASSAVTDNQLPGIDLTNDALKLVPVAPALFNADTLNWELDRAGKQSWNNPLVNSYRMQFNSISRSLTSNLTAGYTFLPGLELRTQLGFSQAQSNSSGKTLLTAIPPSLRSFSTNRAGFSNVSTSTLIAEPQLTYNRHFGKLRFDGLVGGTLQQNFSQNWNMEGQGYTSDLLLNGITGAATTTQFFDKSIYKYNALFTRLGLNFDNQYLLNFSGRRDGSSRFGDKRRFHDFGSVGLGWIMSEARWMESLAP